MAYIGSALSHIQEPIRLDALKFVNVFLDMYPSAMRLFAGQVRVDLSDIMDQNVNYMF